MELMVIHTVHFGDAPLHERLLKVFAFSIQKNSPSTPLKIHRIITEPIPEEIACHKKRGFSAHDIVNTLKTKYHNEIVQNAKDGELLCLMDLDMAVFGDMFPAGEGDFDLGYTVRPERARINSGIMWVRISPKTKDWYQKWYKTVLSFFDDLKKFRPLKVQYGGINQAALGLMLAKPHDLKLKELPGVIWNCTPGSYRKFNPETKVIHLLNNAQVLHQTRNGPGHKVAKAWLALEKESKS